MGEPLDAFPSLRAACKATGDSGAGNSSSDAQRTDNDPEVAPTVAPTRIDACSSTRTRTGTPHLVGSISGILA